MTIHLEHMLPSASRNQPGRQGRKSLIFLRKSHHPYSVLLPVGFTMPPPLPGARCALTAPFHPYPHHAAACEGGSISVALSLGSPPPDVIRHRFSVEPGLSSTAPFRDLRQRSPGQLAICGLGICQGHVNKTLQSLNSGPCCATKNRGVFYVSIKYRTA
jgi:hypothetical protein